MKIPQAIAPPANSPFQRTEVFGHQVTGPEVIHFAGNGPVIRSCSFTSIMKAAILGGLPKRPWDRLNESCIRNGVIRSCDFQNCGTRGLDDGVVMLPRTMTAGPILIERLIFVGCQMPCLYFDDLFSGWASAVTVRDCTFLGCEQAVLVGGGMNIHFENILEVGSKKRSVIDNRGQVDPRTSARGCKWVGPGEAPWEQFALEFEQMGIAIDIPAFASSFQTSGSINGWESVGCEGPQFLDGAEAFWQVKL